MVRVLDNGFVELVDSMGNDLSVVNSARVSFGKKKSKFDEKDKKLIKYLLEHEHTSPFRHASLQFHIKAPIFVLRQWQKHQVGCSWNEISGRYVEFKEEYYIPRVFRKQSSNNKQGSFGEVDATQFCSEVYKNAMSSSFDRYKILLSSGVCREQARMVLPLSLYSECYWTCSLQAVLHFLRLRLDSHSQYEIRQYAAGNKRLCF